METRKREEAKQKEREAKMIKITLVVHDPAGDYVDGHLQDYSSNARPTVRIMEEWSLLEVKKVIEEECKMPASEQELWIGRVFTSRDSWFTWKKVPADSHGAHFRNWESNSEFVFVRRIQDLLPSQMPVNEVPQPITGPRFGIKDPYDILLANVLLHIFLCDGNTLQYHGTVGSKKQLQGLADSLFASAIIDVNSDNQQRDVATAPAEEMIEDRHADSNEQHTSPDGIEGAAGDSPPAVDSCDSPEGERVSMFHTTSSDNSCSQPLVRNTVISYPHEAGRTAPAAYKLIKLPTVPLMPPWNLFAVCKKNVMCVSLENLMSGETVVLASGRTTHEQVKECHEKISNSIEVTLCEIVKGFVPVEVGVLRLTLNMTYAKIQEQIFAFLQKKQDEDSSKGSVAASHMPSSPGFIGLRSHDVHSDNPNRSICYTSKYPHSSSWSSSYYNHTLHSILNVSSHYNSVFVARLYFETLPCHLHSLDDVEHREVAVSLSSRFNKHAFVPTNCTTLNAIFDVVIRQLQPFLPDDLLMRIISGKEALRDVYPLRLLELTSDCQLREVLTDNFCYVSLRYGYNYAIDLFPIELQSKVEEDRTEMQRQQDEVDEESSRRLTTDLYVGRPIYPIRKQASHLNHLVNVQHCYRRTNEYFGVPTCIYFDVCKNLEATGADILELILKQLMTPEAELEEARKSWRVIVKMRDSTKLLGNKDTLRSIMIPPVSNVAVDSNAEEEDRKAADRLDCFLLDHAPANANKVAANKKHSRETELKIRLPSQPSTNNLAS